MLERADASAANPVWNNMPIAEIHGVAPVLWLYIMASSHGSDAQWDAQWIDQIVDVKKPLHFLHLMPILDVRCSLSI